MDRSSGLITLSLDNQGRGTIGPRAITQKVNSGKQHFWQDDNSLFTNS